jgi:arylsulfatase A-like enzyme
MRRPYEASVASRRAVMRASLYGRLRVRIAGLALVGGLLGCHAGDRVRPVRAHGVVLVSIDTLRPDHLGCYGYEQPTTPNVDAFRKDAVLFREAIAHAPSTLPSHASLLTSLIPHHHGASIARGTALATGRLTLAETFRESGFATASFNGGGQLDATFGLDRGFDVYETPGDQGQDLAHDRLFGKVEAGLAWIRGIGRRRFFLFLHSYEVHHPYTPDAEARARLPERYDGSLPPDISIALLEEANAGRRVLTPADRAHIVHAYDREIRSMDDAFGRLVAALRAAGLYEETLLVLTSDHGEEFGEHGAMGWHGHSLHDELLRVPLLIKFPRSWRGGRTMEAQVRGIDVAPTALVAAGVGVPPAFEGTELVAYVAGGTGPPPYAVAALDGGGTALRSREWKWIQRTLFHLSTDPGERVDLADRFPDKADGLRRIKQRFVAEGDFVEGPRAAIDDDLRDRLRSLAYVQ